MTNCVESKPNQNNPNGKNFILSPLAGDRYIGYDYATRKPLEDFLLSEASKDEATATVLSSLPVVGILGRQHSVDGIYHDLVTDLVHVFEGMRFYSYDAKDFKVRINS